MSKQRTRDIGLGIKIYEFDQNSHSFGKSKAFTDMYFALVILDAGGSHMACLGCISYLCYKNNYFMLNPRLVYRKWFIYLM